VKATLAAAVSPGTVAD